MRFARRVLIAIGIALVVMIVFLDFILPAGLSFYLRRSAAAYV
jgi:hypothetical protein